MDGRLHSADLRDQPAAVFSRPPLLAPDEGDRRLRGPRYGPVHSPARGKPGQTQGSAGPQWLTVPVRQSRRDQLIGEIRPDDTQPWPRKLIGTLNNLYAPAPCFQVHAPEIISILEHPHETLTELDRASWEPALRLLGITCR